MKKNLINTDKGFIRQAIKLAEESVSMGGGPFGALVVKEGKIISSAANRVTENQDPTAHAEVEAIRKAGQLLQQHELKGCTLYSSCEPCPMCLGAIYWARIDRLVFASDRQDASAAGFSDAAIYDELNKELNDRSIETCQVHHPDSGREFLAWKKLEDKKEY